MRSQSKRPVGKTEYDVQNNKIHGDRKQTGVYQELRLWDWDTWVDSDCSVGAGVPCCVFGNYMEVMVVQCCECA